MVHDAYGGPHVHMCMKGHMYEGSHVLRFTCMEGHMDIL